MLLKANKFFQKEHKCLFETHNRIKTEKRIKIKIKNKNMDSNQE